MPSTPEVQNCNTKCWIAAGVTGFIVMLFLWISLSALASMFLGAVVFFLVGLLLTWLLCKPAERMRTTQPSEPVSPEALMQVAPSAAPAAVPQTPPAPEPKPAEVTPAADTTPVEAASAAAREPATAALPPETVAAKAEDPAPAAPAPAGGDTGTAMRPAALQGPRDGAADDLKKIKGVGPKLEGVLHGLGFYHFDQIAGWSADEIAWVDENLTGFKGRVTRDDWVAQAKLLAEGGETAFSKKVDKGGVY